MSYRIIISDLYITFYYIPICPSASAVSVGNLRDIAVVGYYMEMNDIDALIAIEYYVFSTHKYAHTYRYDHEN